MPALLARVPGGKKTLIALVIIFIIVAVAGLNVYRSRQQVPVSVATAPAEMQMMGTSILASGSIELVEKQEVYAPDNRLVRQVPVQVGDQVAAGQILVAMEADTEALSLVEAQARLAQEEATYQKYFQPTPIDREIARAEFQRAELTYQASVKKLEGAEKLYRAGAISAQELETGKSQCAADEAAYLKAKKEWDIIQHGPQGAERRSQDSALHRAQEAVKLAEENLAQFVVPARIDGQVMAVQVAEGDVPTPSQHLITIGDPDRLEVQVGIGEYDAARAKKGQSVLIEAAAFPQRQFKGQVVEVSQKAFINKNSQSSQVEIPLRIVVDEQQSGLLPGFTVDVKIITVPEKNRLVVPYEAVVEREGHSYVYVVKDGQARRVKIKTGLQGDLKIEVKGGLKKGDTVILNPPEDLKDGQAVKPETQPVKEGGPA